MIYNYVYNSVRKTKIPIFISMERVKVKYKNRAIARKYYY